MSNSKALAPGENKKPTFSMMINSDGYQKMIKNTLGDPNRCKRFVASITSAVANTPALQDCQSSSILAGALLGESLNLSPSPQLGQFYLVPFNDKKAGVKKAQFILGYKGYLQLVMRSGQVKKINAVEIKAGELIKFDPLNEEIECKLIENWNEREAAETIGYYAFFELTNGFRKAIYWSKEQMMSHADKYSMAFSRQAYINIKEGKIPEKDMWKYSSFWYKNFDDMAKKTMLRQLISKGGCPMSTEMMTAYEKDNSFNEVDDNGDVITVPESNVEVTMDPAQLTQPEATDVVESVNLDDI